MNKPENTQSSFIVDINRIIFILLRGGMLLSSFLLAVGFILLLIFPITAPVPNPTFNTVLQLIFTYPQLGLILIGLLVLMITPILRIVLSIAIFSVDKDWNYTVICSIVLVLVVVSIFLGV
ncbi:MAG: DUF1634 domain-containing protein [Candidatus Odinarchaeota archaeon]